MVARGSDFFPRDELLQRKCIALTNFFYFSTEKVSSATVGLTIGHISLFNSHFFKLQALRAREARKVRNRHLDVSAPAGSFGSQTALFTARNR
jgi:hypothetical protein